MVNTENFFNLGTDYFSFIGQNCHFEILRNDDTHINSKNVLMISSDNDTKKYFSFSGNDGLCLTTEFGSILQKNVLEKFLSLPSNNAKSLFQFFEEYGYFFKMDPNENNIVDFEQLIQVTYHIKAALLLMNELQNSTINYVELLHLTMFLLLLSRVEL